MKKLIFAIRYLYHLLFSGFHHLGWKVAFEKNVRISSAHFIHLGNNLIIGGNTILSATDHSKKQAPGPRLIIEDNVGIGYGTLIMALLRITIKKETMIGPYCIIVDYNHRYQDPTKPISQQGLESQPITIGEGSWIGARSTICAGVTIGKNTVIGAASVVTKDVPDYCVAVGAPAKVVKRYNQKRGIWQSVK